MQASGIEAMNGGRRASQASLIAMASRWASAAWVVSFCVVWLSASVAWANSAPLPVFFTGMGRELPRPEIRVAIATELGRETLAESPAGGEGEAKSEGQEGGGIDATNDQDSRERVVVAVDELGQLWVRYWGPRGVVDRHLAMPAHAEQIPLVVSLSVGNLVRQEAFELLRELERRRAESARASAAEPVAPPPARPKRARARPVPKPRGVTAPRRRNSWGNYLVGDFPYIPGASRACSVGSGIPCYDAHDEPVFFDVPGAGIAAGIQAAHARYVMAYARALTPDVWASLRVGFAFSGGKRKNAASKHDPAMSRFMPWLFELRLQGYPFGSALNGALKPYVHAAAGLAEESAALQLSAPPDSTSSPPQVARVTAIQSLGDLFLGAGLGASLSLFDELRLEAELSGFLAFPSTGWYVRPSVGLSYDF